MYPQEAHKNDWILTTSVAVFILLALGIVGFLYYQNQQLKNIIANYQNATPIPSPTPFEVLQSASPSATPSATPAKIKNL